MFQRNPVRSLDHALRQALQEHLLPVVVTEPGCATAGARRPHAHECDVVMFGQVWSAAALGRDGTESHCVELDTTVVVGPMLDACVYVSTGLLYHVLHPNRRFFLDVAAHGMAAKAEASAYDGRDDPITEAVDIEVGAMLARLYAQVKWAEPRRAPLVARFLHRCAARFEEPLGHVAQRTDEAQACIECRH